MIISHEYKYLFVQLPHTGCTAIAKELRGLYDGAPTHRKHTRYNEFLKNATEDEKKYFTFSSIRNPVEDMVSIFYKLLTNHENYDNPINFIENGGFVTQRGRKSFRFVQESNGNFERFFRKYYKMPYDNWSRLEHRQLNYVIRFENIQDDFAEVIHRIGLKLKRPLPVRNKTKKKKLESFDHFPAALRKKAIWVFAPFMNDWGYEFPKEWGPIKEPLMSRIVYEVAGALRKIYWKKIAPTIR